MAVGRFLGARMSVVLTPFVCGAEAEVDDVGVGAAAGPVPIVMGCPHLGHGTVRPLNESGT